MTSISRTGLAALILAAAMAASSSSALAWGCIAVSGEGSYGYSYQYGDEDSAREKALNECANHTSTSETCEITECDDDS